jgi:hypothetical protein
MTSTDKSRAIMKAAAVAAAHFGHQGSVRTVIDNRTGQGMVRVLGNGTERRLPFVVQNDQLVMLGVTFAL